MADDWEAAAEAEIVIRPPKSTVHANKWEGEDDDEDVKDSWEDEEEKKDEEKSESRSVTPATTAPAKVKPSKALKAKLTEEERLAEEAEAKRLANMTPEEKVAEKLRLLKVQQESDLKSALDTFGVSNVSGSLDAYDPQSKEEFNEFGATLGWKLSQYKESPHFPQFVEDLVRSLCLQLQTGDLKKVKISVENLHTEKVKMEKQNAKKPAAKGKAKAVLRAETNDIESFQKYGNDYDDYDDFM